ncbi:DNA polymerase V [Lachnospiraceae bacterium RM5]|nr:DNA polymerase V [Lachnospiraceae bacterium RM5]
MSNKEYLCIDLKSFYASVECVERNLDPFTTNLVVADATRTEKTITLAITPALKKLGVKNRCRVFEIPKGIDYIMATPRMSLYMEYSANIYGIYLKYISKDDIHVYSVDEVFMDVTKYLKLYNMTSKELAVTIINDVYKSTGITATAGIGTNLYLAKIAMDIVAKHVSDNIGYLTEEIYREKLWNHRPLRDFWRIGSGIEKRLESMGIYTMGDIARADEELLFRTFGIDAELLIDHAWGREITEIEDIKKYKSDSHSLSRGQVLSKNYSFEAGGIIVKEMADLISLDLAAINMLSKSISLMIVYDNKLERKPSKGTIKLPINTSSTKIIMEYAFKLYNEIAYKDGFIKKVTISLNDIIPEEYEQMSFLFDNEGLEKERKLQKMIVGLKDKYGKNIALKGMNLQKDATTIERNSQIGGHRSGD